MLNNEILWSNVYREARDGYRVAKVSESPNDKQRKPHSNHSDRRIAQRREADVSYVYVASSIVAWNSRSRGEISYLSRAEDQRSPISR